MQPDDAARRRPGVRAFRDVQVGVRDGIHLSANLWLPEAAGPSNLVPSILELIPYRKDDWRANADEARGRLLARRGYAFCRVDVRGTGRSDGVALDEYTADETRDGYDTVEWLAAQPWCNGNVGMWGISYGGFTAIQVAALRPPHLRAIVPMYATDDRYLDDVHNVGGCITAAELTQYAVSQLASNALPALPARPGEDWRAAWRARLEATPPWLLGWFRQQRDGPYWRTGSLAPDYDRITAAMLLIGGWMDSYVDPVFRMLARCAAPRRAIVGNWSHEFPDDGYPGPNIDWVHEMTRFFDHWLKGEDTGIMDEPMLTWFQRDFAPAEPFPRAWPGRWRSADGPGWTGGAVDAPDAVHAPDASAGRAGHADLLALPIDAAPEPGGAPGRIRRPGEPAAAASRPVVLPHRPTTGTGGGLSWGAGGPPNGLGTDPRADELDLPVFLSAPLTDPLEILGRATVEVTISASMRIATLVARLSDTAPDGRTCQVTMGILNLTHRASHADPAPLEPGKPTPIRLPLRSAGYRFAPGHRIRLSLGTSCWPVIFPSPLPGELTIHLDDPASPARLLLPLAPRDVPTPTFRPAPTVDDDPVGAGTEAPPSWRVTHDVLDRSITVTTHQGDETILPDGSSLATAESHALRASELDPADASMASRIRYRLERADGRIEVDVDALTRAAREDLEVEIDLEARLDGQPFFTRRYEDRIARDLA